MNMCIYIVDSTYDLWYMTNYIYNIYVYAFWHPLSLLTWALSPTRWENGTKMLLPHPCLNSHVLYYAADAESGTTKGIFLLCQVNILVQGIGRGQFWGWDSTRGLVGHEFDIILSDFEMPKCRSSVSSVSGYPPKTNTAPHRQVWKMIFLFYQWDMLVSGSVCFLSQELPIPVVLLGFSKGGAVGDPQLLWQLHPQRSSWVF